jgi:hypothetical protein
VNDSAPLRTPELRWIKPDAFHIRTDCGRYAVSRVDLGGRDDYVAWRIGLPAVELAAAPVLRSARDEERSAAIKSMQQQCVEDLECALAATVTGLAHLEGETVQVFADGERQPDKANL